MTVSPNPRARLADRIGIIPRLLAGAFLALAIAVASVQFWTLREVEANGLRQAQDALGGSMAMLRHELAPLGAAWSTTADGRLAFGATTLNGRNDLVDAVRDATGAAVTIFLGDTRVATNVKNPDGSRGVGTRLAAGAPRPSWAHPILRSMSRSAMPGRKPSESCLSAFPARKRRRS